MSGHTSICFLVSDQARKPFILLYPEARVASGAQICAWYDDAIANGEIIESEPHAIWQKAKALHEAGLITLHLT